MLSPGDRFGMQDETFIAVEFLSSHPVFNPFSSITCSSYSDVYLHADQLTLTHFIPAQYEKNVTVYSDF